MILGVLSAIAVPKFISLTDAANQSKISALAGAMRSASSLVFAKCVVSTSFDQNAGPAAGNGLSNSLVAEGESITLAFGYPRHTTAGIVRSVNINDLADGGDYYIRSFTSGVGLAYVFDHRPRLLLTIVKFVTLSH